MQPAVGVPPPRQAQLYDLCSQFEQVLLASLVPRSLFHTDSTRDEDSGPSVESGQSAALFTQALVSALERAGGLGLGRDMFGWLSQGQS